MPSEAKLEDFEPHLQMTVGSHIYVWHRFKKPTREKGHVTLHTKCGRDINDHWNVRPTFNPRLDDFCAKCFPNGINKDGSSKDAPSTRNSAGRKQEVTSSSRPLTSAAEPLVSEDSDDGDGGAASEQGSGVQRDGDEGHVEELPDSGGSGDSSVEGGTDQEAGQGKSNQERRKESGQRSTEGRKSKGQPDR